MMQFVEEETDKYASKVQKVNLFFFFLSNTLFNRTKVMKLWWSKTSSG